MGNWSGRPLWSVGIATLWQQLGVPLVLGIGGLVGGFISWKVRSKIEEAREDRARLIAERRQTNLASR